MFNRSSLIARLNTVPLWDVIVIGGGATGLGIALDAASRGYTTLLLEKHDFAKGTSSRSTKLVHGGVRYLEQGNIQLVYGALRERGLLLKNAPHLVKKQSFVIPCYGPGEKMKYLTGLTIYDWLSSRYSFGRSRLLSQRQLKEIMPDVKEKRLTGGVLYYDGQFDDARLAINLMQTSIEQGATVLNYTEVSGLLKDGRQRVCGVAVKDKETGVTYECRSKTVINATGVFVDDILSMDEKGHQPLVTVSQGIHLVFDASKFKSRHALLIPKTSDGRVLFAVPWHKHLLVGTTDTPVQKCTEEPTALQQEIEFVLQTFSRYRNEPVLPGEVRAVFAGLRPLIRNRSAVKSTKELSRDHKIVISDSGLITITGGKWTTYRKMAEDAVNTAVRLGQLKAAPCITKELPIHGSGYANVDEPLSVYGSDAAALQSLVAQHPEWGTRLTTSGPWIAAQVVWAARNEMARTVEDALARRLRILFLDAREAIVAAPLTASIMAKELGFDPDWQREQISQFVQLAQHYLLH